MSTKKNIYNFLIFIYLFLCEGNSVFAAQFSLSVPNISFHKNDGAQMEQETSLTSSEIVIRALEGGKKESFKLALGEVSGGQIAPYYYSAISAQNGNSGLEFAQKLYWSGNLFNQLRALFWCNDQSNDIFEEVFFGGIIIDNNNLTLSKKRNNWKNILNKKNQSIMIKRAIEQLIRNPVEIDLLINHSQNGLLGSKNDAKILWEYYKRESKTESAINSILGSDWLYLVNIELQGFPGATFFNKYLFWLMVAAENGDPKSQWQLAHEFNINDYASNARRSFWLKKSKDGGFKE